MPPLLAALALLASGRPPAPENAIQVKPPAKGSPSQGSPAQGSSAQKPGDIRRDGRPFIKAPVGEPATLAQIRGWDGWKLGPILNYPTFGEVVTTEVPAPPTADAAAVPYKLRVFVFTRIETRLASGVVRRTTIEPEGVKRLRAATENLRAIVRSASNGKVELVPSLAVDDEPITVGEIPATLPLRMNGGRFDAEDGVDRGPFSGAIVVGPGSSAGGLGSGIASGTPWASVDFYRAGGDAGGTALEFGMLQATIATMVSRLNLAGAETRVLSLTTPAQESGWPDLGRWLRAEDLPLLRPGFDLPAAALVAAEGPHASPPRRRRGEGAPFVGADVYLDADPETKPETPGGRGTVLRLRETSPVRRTGLYLPKVAIPADRRLAFWARVGSGDSFALAWYREANDDLLEERTIVGPVDTERGAEFALDGGWHRVVLAVPPDAQGLEIVASRPDGPRRDLPAANVWLDDFEWTTDAATPIVAGPSAEAFERVSTASGDDLAPFLADISPEVRLVALTRMTKEDAALEPAVIRLAATEIVGENSQAAVEALARFGTPAAVAAMRSAIVRGPTEIARQTAARALAATGDPANIIAIVPLTQRVPWRTRLAAVEALGAYRQENAVRFRLSATLQENPELRYAALRPATTENPDERQKLLYAAINDPSDAIRAFAADRLLDAKDPAVRAEGLRGTADDSAWVRVLVQRALAKRANPELKSGVLKGLADPVGPVRAEALRALVALGPPEAGEIAPLLVDPHPDVLLALKELGEAGKIALPDSVKARIAASKDARLAAKEPIRR